MSSMLLTIIQNEIRNQIDFDRFIVQIREFIDVSQIQIDKMRRNLTKYEIVVASSSIRERSRKMIEKMKNFLLEYINLHSIKYLNEMCWYVYDEFDIVVSEFILCKMLKRRKWIHKKVSFFFFFFSLLHHSLCLTVSTRINSFDRRSFVCKMSCNDMSKQQNSRLES